MSVPLYAAPQLVTKEIVAQWSYGSLCAFVATSERAKALVKSLRVVKRVLIEISEQHAIINLGEGGTTQVGDQGMFEDGALLPMHQHLQEMLPFLSDVVLLASVDIVCLPGATQEMARRVLGNIAHLKIQNLMIAGHSPTAEQLIALCGNPHLPCIISDIDAFTRDSFLFRFKGQKKLDMENIQQTFVDVPRFIEIKEEPRGWTISICA